MKLTNVKICLCDSPMIPVIADKKHEIHECTKCGNLGVVSVKTGLIDWYAPKLEGITTK
jgi:hypothetical protein